MREPRLTVLRSTVDLRAEVDKLERRILARAFAECRNLKEAAEWLGMPRTTLVHKLDAMGVANPYARAEVKKRPPKPRVKKKATGR